MQEDLSAIQSTVLFKSFAADEVEQALRCLEGITRDFARKQIVFRKDDVLDSVGVILEGQVLLCRESISGARFIFAELERGDILGETALRLPREHSGYEAIAGSACRILMIKMNKIIRPGQDTCRLRGRIIENMLALLLENNRSIYQKLDMVSHKSLRQRIMYFLSLQAKKHNSVRFEIPFSRSDMADYLAVDRSALSRELQRMVQEGMIHVFKNRFELLVPVLEPFES